MSKKVMISQPMRGKTDLEIATVHKSATQYLESKGYEVVNTIFKEGLDQIMEDQPLDKSIYYLLINLLLLSVHTRVSRLH